MDSGLNAASLLCTLFHSCVREPGLTHIFFTFVFNSLSGCNWFGKPGNRIVSGGLIGGNGTMWRA